ncbi:hypothetical protein [Streptomyces sp. NBC_01443]|uniref:hypothetical protein n=1 Tax=Streptomyces sp. NBC_01443 TaxID=2903868 RepID=UPI002B1CAD39|nr:hypothetical protein [Streptomyces sp. NBC_01443]
MTPEDLLHDSLAAAADAPPAPGSEQQYNGLNSFVTEQSPYPWAEGGVISTAADLDRFFTALFRGRLLPPAP